MIVSATMDGSPLIDHLGFKGKLVEYCSMGKQCFEVLECGLVDPVKSCFAFKDVCLLTVLPEVELGNVVLESWVFFHLIAITQGDLFIVLV